MKNDYNRKLAVLNNFPKRALSLDHEDKKLFAVIGYVSTHTLPFLHVYAEEVRNLKEGKWYPYKVFFPTPYGWLKVDNSTVCFRDDVNYNLGPVESMHVLRAWKDVPTMRPIITLLGLNAPEGEPYEVRDN
jgi:hypothetical protein